MHLFYQENKSGTEIEDWERRCDRFEEKEDLLVNSYQQLQDCEWSRLRVMSRYFILPSECQDFSHTISLTQNILFPSMFTKALFNSKGSSRIILLTYKLSDSSSVYRKQSCSKISLENWFQDPHRHQIPWMLKLLM